MSARPNQNVPPHIEQASAFCTHLDALQDPLNEQTLTRLWAWAESVWQDYLANGTLAGGRLVNALFGAVRLPDGLWPATLRLYERSPLAHQQRYLERLAGWHEAAWQESQQALDLSRFVPGRSAEEQRELLQSVGRYGILSHLEKLGCSPQTDPVPLLEALQLRAALDKYAAPVALRICQSRGPAYLELTGEVVAAADWAKPTAGFLALCAEHQYQPGRGTEFFAQRVLVASDVEALLMLARLPGVAIAPIVDRLVQLGDPDALLEIACLPLHGVTTRVWQGLMAITPTQCAADRYINSLDQFLRNYATVLCYPEAQRTPQPGILRDLAAVMLGTLTLGDQSLVVLRPLVAQTLRMLRESEAGSAIAEKFEATRHWTGNAGVGERFMFALYGPAGQDAVRVLIAMQIPGMTSPALLANFLRLPDADPEPTPH